MREHYKIINDPVHGFIHIPRGIIQQIIEHPLFQRLRDIKQLGLTALVYPGACHTRLSHALGAMHLMHEAINTLISKGVNISDSEQEQTMAAILLHDVGHGPFSHSLENNILCGVSHEEISLAFIKMINRDLGGEIDMAIDIFTGDYHKRFLHQLVSSQLDVDRLDYLRRDSFFSGVAEGMIGHERIINMMNVFDNNLVIEEKGIYSVEKFLISRRLMYWQVYLHKTVIGAELLLRDILRRARELVNASYPVSGSEALLYFLNNSIESHSLDDSYSLKMFGRLDDTDVMWSIKEWCNSDDFILSMLCKMLVERKLPRIILLNEPYDGITFERLKRDYSAGHLISEEILGYLFKKGEVQNRGYDRGEENIRILSKRGEIGDIYDISDMLTTEAFSQITKKYYLCTPKINISNEI